MKLAGAFLAAAALGALLLPPLAGQPLRVASWNIGQARDAAAVREGLRNPRLSSECDVLALQETGASEDDDLVAALASERGWRFTGNASNAILSRWPILRSGRAVIGVSRTRELPWAEIDAPFGPVRVYSVHLTFRNGGWPFEQELRFQETAWILYHLERTEPPPAPDTPVILAGDFNTAGWVLGGHQREKAMRLLASRRFFPAPGDGATHMLFGRLDWIVARGLQGVDGGVGSFSGSDHRWLWAQLEPVGQDAIPPSVAIRGASLAAIAPLGALLGVTLTWLGRKRLYREPR